LASSAKSIDELNCFMVYKAALKMVIADGKPCLTRNQAFLMSVLVANADGFN